MKAVILCGGQGTRLREHTDLRPKPMIEIGGRPILWHIMKIYAHYGICDFVLCLGYKAAVIKDYFLNYQAMMTDFTISLNNTSNIQLHDSGSINEDWKVTLADTGEETMTGARVSRASCYLADDDTFFVTYGDGVSDIDINALLSFHRSHGKLATITGVRPPSRFGELQCDGKRVHSFSEKPVSGNGLINGGYFCFQRDFLRYLSDDRSCILERSPLESCARDGQLQVFEHQGFWQCMDTFRDWTNLESQWQGGNAPWKAWGQESLKFNPEESLGKYASGQDHKKHSDAA
jgi:glucose-1-phosphate cytidylyltransferase